MTGPEDSRTAWPTDGSRDAYEHPARGVVGLVDDLLRLCQEQGLHLDWQGDSCRVRSLTRGTEEVLTTPLRKSVFRAVLARVATLCNERSPNSISPYRGQGELTVGADPSRVVRVGLVNNPSEQRLELIPLRPGTGERETRVSLADSPTAAPVEDQAGSAP